jgi:hypothetical protein
MERPLTVEERHWRGVRRSATAAGVGVACFVVGLLGDYLDWFPLTIAGRLGFIACWFWLMWAFLDVFRAWFLKNS